MWFVVFLLLSVGVLVSVLCIVKCVGFVNSVDSVWCVVLCLIV